MSVKRNYIKLRKSECNFLLNFFFKKFVLSVACFSGKTPKYDVDKIRSISKSKPLNRSQSTGARHRGQLYTTANNTNIGANKLLILTKWKSYA